MLDSQPFEDIQLDRPAPRVLRITLHRPAVKNALRSKLLRELATALDQANQDQEIGCVIITGGPEVFAAGADVREVADNWDREGFLQDRQTSWQTIRQFTKPLIAAVNGYALGGGNELVMHCDLVIASANAKFGQPEIKLGLMPGAQGVRRLVEKIGRAQAMKYLLTGEFIDAPTAQAAGLITEIAPDPDARALELAEQVAAMPLEALQSILKAVDGEAEILFEELFQSPDAQEGMRAFLEKRKPEFNQP